MIKVAIVEDNANDAQSLKSTIMDWANNSTNIEVTVDLFTGVKTFEKSADLVFFNIVFFDIELPDGNGYETAKHIRNDLGYNNYIAFLTNYNSYSLEGYEVEAIRYMLKPLNPEKIFECMNYILMKTTKSCFCFNFNGLAMRIPYDDILYIESTKHYIDIYTNNSSYRIKLSLKEVEAIVPACFFRCHRSYVINMDYISKFSGKNLYLSNGVEIPVAVKQMADFRKALSAYTLL